MEQARSTPHATQMDFLQLRMTTAWKYTHQEE